MLKYLCPPTYLNFFLVSIALIMSIGHVQVGHVVQLIDFQEFQFKREQK
jgi:hypothetical protein